MISVSLGLIVEGMHYGWSASAIPKLLSNESAVPLTPEDATYVVQMFTYGSITHTVLSLAEYPKLNQKAAVVLSVIVMILSWILIGTCRSTILLMIARFLAGAGRGLVYQVSVSYICEIADPKVRGFLASLVVVMMNVGLFVIYALGPQIDLKYVAIFGASICVLELLAIRHIPESPYILLLRGKTSSARRVLKSLRNLWNVEDELDALTATVQRQDNENDSFWTIFTVGSNMRAMLLMIMLNVFQLLSGVHIFIHHILKLAGGDIKSHSVAMLTSLMSTITCTLAAALLDVVGRKPILMFSFGGEYMLSVTGIYNRVAISPSRLPCNYILAITDNLSIDTSQMTVSGASLIAIGCYTCLTNELNIVIDDCHIVPLLCLTVNTTMYKLGIGMVPLVMSGELFPMNAKNSACTLCSLISVLLSFASIKLLTWISSACGVYCLYFFCGNICIIGVFFTRFFVPETAKKTLEEIQIMLKN
ncbi:Trehalose transporter 1-2 [Carabus blaptoides fortunei]